MYRIYTVVLALIAASYAVAQEVSTRTACGLFQFQFPSRSTRQTAAVS